MKLSPSILRVLVLLAACFAVIPVAQAGHRHTHTYVGVQFGFPGPWYYGPPYGAYYRPYSYYQYYPSYYYEPPAIYVRPPQPTVYIERPVVQPATTTLPAGYWYYCPPAQGYYPYVKECSVPWQAVSPQPSGK